MRENGDVGAILPELTPREFGDRLVTWLHHQLDPSVVATLYAHYRELGRWNPHLSLIGPGTIVELVERHYGESLAALPLLPAGPGRLLDLGSGAGFPGWVLAAARPDFQVTLIEAQGRKVTFLRTAAHRAGVAVHVVDGRVGPVLPEGFPSDLDRITVRALKLKPRELECVAQRLRAEGEILLWAGRDDPVVPEGWRRVHEQRLPGRARRVLAYRPNEERIAPP